jgi:hypothetical protein
MRHSIYKALGKKPRTSTKSTAARKGTKKKDGADTKAEADPQANGIYHGVVGIRLSSISIFKTHAPRI